MSQEQHPLMLKMDELLIQAGQPGWRHFSHNNGTAGNASTTDNFFRILRNILTEGNFALCCLRGDHRESLLPRITLLRILAQTSDERVLV